jgi:hypothetical protein
MEDEQGELAAHGFAHETRFARGGRDLALSPRFLTVPRTQANTGENPPKTLSLAGRCSRLFVAVRGGWDRKGTAEWPLRSHWKPEPIPAS